MVAAATVGAGVLLLASTLAVGPRSPLPTAGALTICAAIVVRLILDRPLASVLRLEAEAWLRRQRTRRG